MRKTFDFEQALKAVQSGQAFGELSRVAITSKAGVLALLVKRTSGAFDRDQ